MRRCHPIEQLVGGLLVAIMVGVVIHAPLTVWLGSLFPAVATPIKAWKEVLLGLAVLGLGLALVRRRAWRHQDWRRLPWWVWWAIGLILIHLAMMIWWRGPFAAVVAGGLIDLRFVVYALVVYGLVRLCPAWRPLLIGAAVAGAVVVVGFGVAQLWLPPDILAGIGYGPGTIMPYLTIDQHPDFIRINSTLRGPNPLGIYAGLVLVAVTVWWSARQLRLRPWYQHLAAGVTALAAGAVLYASHSRSAWVAAAVALVVVGAVRWLPLVRRVPWWGWLVVAGLVVGAGWLVLSNQQLTSTVILHENPDGGSALKSNSEHLRSFNDGIERLARQPLGAGVGSTGSASLLGSQPLIIENYYLLVAHEAGWLGLASFIGLMVAVLAGLWQRRRDHVALVIVATGVGIALACLVLPVWADDTVSLVWWGLAAVALAARPVATTRAFAQQGLA